MPATSNSFKLSLSSQSGRKYIGKTQNVLNEYRSYTYNFTLAALKAESLKYPESYRSSSLDFVIIKTGGKDKGLNSDAVVNPVTEISSNELQTSVSTADIVKSFNKNSPGRFDFFMDNLEVETIMCPSQETGSALATSIKFDVTEPYSMNGFIDALRVSAISAGHLNYVAAIFLLKVEFKGYPDDDTSPSVNSESIDYATRYFPIKFTGIDVTVTEQGTKYSCSAIPYNEQGYATSNTIIADLKMSGKQVGEILEDMFKSLNDKIEEKIAAEKDPEVKRNRDRYEIYFPDLDPKAGLTSETVKTAKRNDKMWTAPMNKELSENNVFKFPDPQTGYNDKNPPAPEENRNPDKVAVMFASGSNIHDIIAAVIRDSTYLRDILKDVDKAKDDKGMIDYFKVHINAVPEVIDTTLGMRIHTYQYIVTPYKIHYTRLPGYKSSLYDTKDLAPLVKREYNYIYTGKNLDILGFNLKFNTLYFQASAPLMGNVTNQGSGQSAVATKVDKVNVSKGTAVDAAKQNQTPAPPLQTDVKASQETITASPGSDDPYYRLAIAAHKSVLESVDMIQAEMDIVGDPYYLVTGGAGNFIPPADDPSMTTDGEANIQSAETLVKFNFRNPIDFDYTTGFMTFDKVVEYSGIYKVIKAQSSFKEGAFKQHLTMIRMPGQVEDEKAPPPNPTPLLASVPSPASALKADTAAPDIQKAGVKPNNFDLSKLTGAVQKASGLVGQGINLIDKANQISGFNLVNGNLSATIDKVASTTRLAENGLNTVAGLASVASNSSIPGVDALTKSANALTSNLKNIGSSVADAVGSAKDKISSILAGGDAAGAAAAAGIDTASISGLGGKLEGEAVSQLKTITDSLPKGVDLDKVKKSGLILANLTGAAMKNLPHFPVKAKVPEASISAADKMGLESYKATITAELDAKKAAIAGETSAGTAIPTSVSDALADVKNAASSAASALPNVTDMADKSQLINSVTGSLDNLSSVAGASNLGSSVPGIPSLSLGASELSNNLATNGNLLNSKDLATQFGSIATSADSAINTVNNATRGTTQADIANIKASTPEQLQARLTSINNATTSPLASVMNKQA